MTSTENRQTVEAFQSLFRRFHYVTGVSPLACGVWRRGLRSCTRDFFDYRCRISFDFVMATLAVVVFRLSSQGALTSDVF